jgi:hypothetical protein
LIPGPRLISRQPQRSQRLSRLQRGRHAGKRIGQFAAEAVNDRNDRDRNASSDKPILDRSRARVVFQETQNKLVHLRCIDCYGSRLLLSELTCPDFMPREIFMPVKVKGNFLSKNYICFVTKSRNRAVC